ncbi:MAG: hypothetical protein LBC86_01085 [Oscillospiraceae bacterium]|jgi:hypothetical protein|nr:hypothetical protein [Oscillospiraceae bacterium]
MRENEIKHDVDVNVELPVIANHVIKEQPMQSEEIKSNPVPLAASEVQNNNPNIIGNTAFTNIENKKYFKMNSELAGRVAAELENQDMSFSGRINGGSTTLTIGAADVIQYMGIVKSVNSQERETPEKPSNVIGNTDYRDIEDRKYTNVDSSIADSVSAELNKQGVKFRGLVNDNNKTTFTTSLADVDKVKAAVDNVKGVIKSVKKLSLADRFSEKKEQMAQTNANREKPDKSVRTRVEAL